MGKADHTRWNDSAHMPAESTQTLTKGVNGAIGVTRVRNEERNAGKTAPYEQQEAYLVVLQLRAFARQQLWVDGKPAPVAPFKSGAMAVYDLQRLWIADLEDKYDTLHFYIPQTALDQVADEMGGKLNTRLHRPPHENVVDPTVQQIGQLLLPALARPQEASMLFVEHMTLALQAHLLKQYGNKALARPRIAGGLTGWQERRATDFMLAHLSQEFSLDDVAAQCGLSKGHFIKAFRERTGLPPHQWLIAQRIERAKQLMKGTDLALAEVAFQCGFSDQSHLSRLFKRIEGQPPGEWRTALRVSILPPILTPD